MIAATSSRCCKASRSVVAMGRKAPSMSETPVAGWSQALNGLWYPPPPACGCPLQERVPPGWESKIHTEQQDTGGEAWRILLELVDRAAADGREKFTPREDMPLHLWPEIVTLPATIATLTNVRELQLYGSYLIAIPPEIGEMSSLTTFTPYTSRRLHWFPYEITRCAKLQDSR